jgi:hypothetical protein
MPKLKKYKGLQEFGTTLNTQGVIKLIDTKVKSEGRDVTLMNKTNWDNLKLVEQLMYLKEKLSELTTTLSQDNQRLSLAKEELRKCYLATPYVDYLKELEKTKKEDRLLMVQKNYSTFENKLTDISKYCNGFGYANSSCFYNCQNACPSTDPAFLSYIQDCKTQDCDSICAENTIACRAKKSACFIKENNCLAERLLRKETCPNDSSGNFGNFEECIDSCQTECSSDCETKFKSCSEIDKACNDCSSKLDKDSNFPGVCSSISKKYCSDEFEKCQNICKNNSQCIINNKESCIYSPQNLLACATENTDNENKKYCVENSGFTCKYGSSQQAGYADCLKNPYSLGNKFTSSEIYKNQFQQKCPAPYLTDPSSSCYSSSSPNSSCIDVCPEVSKCPSASNCPKCPCNTTSIDTNPSNFNSKGKAFYSVYVHMKNISVTIGQVVNQGDIIGQISNIGTDTGSHLHFAVGFENGKTGLDVATSFDISSKVTASGMSGIGSGYTAPLPTYVNENYKNYVLNSLTPPVNTNQCDWKQNPGSYLHNNTASYAQDWICNNGSQEGSNVQVMAGGDNIKSTVSGIVPASGAVIIKHEVNENILSSLINSIISDYQIVGGECQEYKYNDDPLTFYCKQDWWNEPALQAQEPLANSYICPKEKEIPVGQAVDDTQFWAKKLSAYQSDFALKTDELINHLIKISKEKEYCKCGSTCGSRSSEKTCNAPCVPELLTDPVTGAESCVCANQGCQGNPCQYIINLLMGSTGASCPKGEIIKGPLQFYNELKSKLKTIYDFMQISRTDIIKELIYSRKTMNTCSVESKANTVAEQTRLESCRRVRNNFVSPIADDKTTINNQEIKYPCYGVDLGEIYGDTFSSSTTKEPIIPETDNWFCCVPRD